MSLFFLSTDSTCDMPQEFYKEHSIEYAKLNYEMNGDIYPDGENLTSSKFYQMMREGNLFTTSQVSPAVYENLFESIIKINGETTSIFHFSFSSALSGSYQSAVIASKEISEKYPNAKIAVFDSKAASAGQGLFLYYIIKLRDQNKTLEEAVKWAEDHQNEFIHLFTVEDLAYLQRGGRVSKAAAFMASMLNIKPILHVDDKGCLIALEKVRGRKASLDRIIDLMGEKLQGYTGENEIFFVSQGDCREEATEFCEQIKNRYGIPTYLVTDVGLVIGSHTGPGVVALFFRGKEK